jgi:hypothetical protein
VHQGQFVQVNQFPHGFSPPSPSSHRISSPLARTPAVHRELHHVWPTVSSPPGSVIAVALAAAASRTLQSHSPVRIPCDTQLFRRLARDLVRSAAPGLRVGAANGLPEQTLTLPDGLPSRHHSALFFSRSREVMVRIIRETCTRVPLTLAQPTLRSSRCLKWPSPSQREP